MIGKLKQSNNWKKKAKLVGSYFEDYLYVISRKSKSLFMQSIVRVVGHLGHLIRTFRNVNSYA